jgi:hypothetical protein
MAPIHTSIFGHQEHLLYGSDFLEPLVVGCVLQRFSRHKRNKNSMLPLQKSEQIETIS